jgi:myosin heavy subunit
LGLEPHVYEISTSAYRGLVCDKQDQTILVTGETGAGKTETVKILMSHLATIPKNSAMDIVNRVCQSSPVFEAFGNAKTLRNDNSSRFGKFTQMQFRVEDANADMVGSFCTTYLLEKTRVVSHAPGERTYHIFYQLMSASPEFKSQLWPFFAITEVKDFAYLCHSGDMHPHLHADTEQWAETKEALSLFQFTGEKLHELMRALGIVLQLGNLVFNDVNDGNYGDHNTVITSIFELERLSEMTGIECKELEESMTCRILKTGSEDIKVKAPPQVAKEWCDALAKEIYAKLFDMMVRRINDSTAGGQNVKGLGHISLLDIFGFERFEVNRLEQLCINYANEKLHNKYVLDNFNAIKEEYEAEGVDLYDFSLVDNSDVLELMESPEGLIASLNEQCNLPRGNDDENFVSKIKRTNQRRSSFANNKLHNRSEFEVQHFAGPVVYDAHTFVERNMDKLPEGIGEIAAKSTNTLIKAEFERVESETGPTTRRAAMKRHKFVFQKFQAQLRSLMLAMENSKTRYIRCIKPNSEFAPRKTDHLGTLHQLECSGLMTAIAMTREGYPDKLSYAIFGDRFACLMRAKEFKNIRGMEPQQKVEVILSKLLKPRLIQCGKTRVYFKSGAKEQLEVLRLEYFHKTAVAIQSAVRRSQAMDSFSKSMKVTIFLQKSWRMTIEKNLFRRKILSATRLSATMRRHLLILGVERMRQESAATKIQSQFRTQHSVGELRRTKRAAASIQKSVRKAQAVHYFASSRLAIVKLQSVMRMGGQSIAYKRKKNSATQVSSWFRVVQARKVTARMRKERDAASTIQKAARLALKKRQDSATAIQREYRRRSFKKKDYAATVIRRGRVRVRVTTTLKALKQPSPGKKSNVTTKM